MSMETHVFFRGKLPSKAALTRAMKELGLPFSITPPAGSLESQSGYMTMKLSGEETGVEFDVYGDYSAVEEFADVGVDAGFERRASLRWGGDKRRWRECRSPPRSRSSRTAWYSTRRKIGCSRLTTPSPLRGRTCRC